MLYTECNVCQRHLYLFKLVPIEETQIGTNPVELYIIISKLNLLGLKEGHKTTTWITKLGPST